MNKVLSIKVPGKLRAIDTAVVSQGSPAVVVVGKTIVVTSDDWMEFIPEDVTYIISDKGGKEVDEVVDLTGSGIGDASDQAEAVVKAIQKAAQMALIVSEPGPVAVRFLTKLVDSDAAVTRLVNRSQRSLAGEKKIKTAKGKAEYRKRVAAQQTSGKSSKDVWYKAKDGKGFTRDPKQARMYAGKPVLARDNAVA